MVIRLGVLLPQNKKAKIKLPDRILKLCEEEEIEVVDLISDDDLYEKGPFDVFLHKVKDYYREFEPEQVVSIIRNVKKYCYEFKEMVVIDNFEESERLTDRIFQTEVMKSCEMVIDGIKIFLPKTVEISADVSVEEIRALLSSKAVKFPILVKPITASLNDSSRHMRLIFTPDNLKDLTLPCLIQEFCNHGGVMYKVFVIGNNFNICERPSIKDVDCESRESLFFDTRDVSKLGKTFIPDLHNKNPSNHVWRSCDDNPNLLNRNVVANLCSLLRKLTNLYLLGVDILIEKETGNYALVDVNHFPGYSEISEKSFTKNLVRLIKELGTKKV